MVERLLIFQKLYDFVLVLYPVINRIPKSHRMVLGREIETICLSILVLLIKANKTNINNRIGLQTEISDNLDILRILIRLTKDLRFMSVGQYGVLAQKLNEIGKMVYGWRQK